METDRILLKIHAERNHYTFCAGISEDETAQIGTVSTRLLSTEVMKVIFTGCFFDLFAEGETAAHFPYFRVSGYETQKKPG